MYKRGKITLLLICLFYFLGFGKSEEKIKSDSLFSNALKNGIYLNIGISFPSMSIVFPGDFKTFDSNSHSLGLQANFEFGNRWNVLKFSSYFIGISCSWIQLGYSNFPSKYIMSINHWNSNNPISSNTEIRIVKIIPRIKYLLSKKCSIEASFGFSPTLFLGSQDASNTEISYFGYGLLLTPGLQMSWKNLFVGSEIGFGTLKGDYLMKIGVFEGYENIKYNVVSPRIYLGYNF